MRNLLVVAVVLVSGSAVAGDWQGLTWGMGWKEAREAYKGELYCPGAERTPGSVPVPKSAYRTPKVCISKEDVDLGRNKFEVQLQFEKGKLVAVRLEGDKANHHDYRYYQQQLTKKYGKRSGNSLLWSAWETKRNRIELDAEGEYLVIRYSDLGRIKKKEEEAKAKAADML